MTYVACLGIVLRGRFRSPSPSRPRRDCSARRRAAMTAPSAAAGPPRAAYTEACPRPGRWNSEGIPRRARSRPAPPERVAEFLSNGECLLKVVKGRRVSHPGERPAKLVEYPGLAEPVACLPPALHGNAKGGHAVRPVAPPVEQRETAREAPPGDLVQARSRGLACGRERLARSASYQASASSTPAKTGARVAGRPVPRHLVAAR